MWVRVCAAGSDTGEVLTGGWVCAAGSDTGEALTEGWVCAAGSDTGKALTEEQLLRRRLRYCRELHALYKVEYWALAEELRARHCRYQAQQARPGAAAGGFLNVG